MAYHTRKMITGAAMKCAVCFLTGWQIKSLNKEKTKKKLVSQLGLMSSMTGIKIENSYFSE